MGLDEEGLWVRRRVVMLIRAGIRDSRMQNDLQRMRLRGGVKVS